MGSSRGPTPAEPDRAPTVGRLLYLAHRAQHDVLDARLSELGASVWNWVLLRTAVQHDGASQRVIAEEMRIEPPTLVRHLDKLAADGFVERRRDEQDRRVTRVHVTPAGRSRLDALHEVVSSTDAETRALFDARELDDLKRALARVAGHFGVHDGNDGNDEDAEKEDRRGGDR